LHGGSPFLTDDPEPVDLRHPEINVIYQQTRFEGGRGEAFSSEVSYGCVQETQCHVALPQAFNRPVGATSGRG